jgi:hypothetical protein
MNKLKVGLVFCVAMYAMSAAAQITGSGTSGTVPLFTGSSTIGNSNITQSTSGTTSGNVGIGIGSSTPQGTLQVGTTSSAGALYVASNLADTGYIAPQKGVWIEWNDAAGMTAFVNNEGGSTGGWQFVNTNSSGTVVATPMVIQGTSGYVGIGTTSPTSALQVNGNVLVSGTGNSITFPDGTVQTTAFSTTLCGGDYAESVDVTGSRTNYEPGDVLVIDPNSPGKFLKANEAYSTLVAGIYSTKPGTVGRRQTTDAKTSTTEVPMAMVGIVPTKVTAENGPIKVGDLLVASSSLGHAMKGTDRSLLTGAVIGKALGSLDSGTGVIEVLVTLQ